MLKIDTWEPTLPEATTSVRHKRFGHAGQDSASLGALLRGHSVEHRCVGRVTAWVGKPGTGGGGYAVMGWTSAAILRSSLSSRLDALNPVAAFRLLEQPEIEQLVRSGQDYVVLRRGLGPEWVPELAGSVSGLDLDLWIGSPPTELDGAVALSFDTYLRRFTATEVAA